MLKTKAFSLPPALLAVVWGAAQRLRRPIWAAEPSSLREEPFGSSEEKPHKQTFDSNAEQHKIPKGKLKISRGFVGQKSCIFTSGRTGGAGEKF